MEKPNEDTENKIVSEPVNEENISIEIIEEENVITQQVPTLQATQKCSSCRKELPIDSFIGVKNVITKGCAECREKNRIRDTKRDKEHRNEIARKMKRNPNEKQSRQSGTKKIMTIRQNVGWIIDKEKWKGSGQKNI
jgi:hypothetical protein